MHPAGDSDIAIVTVTYRSAGEIGTFLTSLGEMPPGRVVVADNPSEQTDETAEIARLHGARFVPLPRNVGYGAAVNAAVATLDADVRAILISNPDVRVLPGAVAALRDALDAHARVGAAGPKVLNEDGTVYPSARSIPSLRTGIGHALFSRMWPENPWTRAYRQESSSSDDSRDVGWLSGSCLLVRRAAFDEVGGFDESYFMYFEDVDLGYRLGKQGWVSRYAPTASVVHFGARSTDSVRSQMLVTHHRSAQRFLARKYAGWPLAPVRLALRVGLELRARWLLRR